MEQDKLPDEQLNWIQESKLNAEKKHRRLRRLNTQTIIAGLVTSTLATLLAGYTAASNSPLINWRWACDGSCSIYSLCYYIYRTA